MSVKFYHSEEEGEEEEEEEEIEEEGKKKYFKSPSNLRGYRLRHTSQQDKKQKYSIKKTQPKTRRYKRKKKAIKRCS